MEETFGIIMLAIVDGEPKILNLKDSLLLFRTSKADVIVRRTRFDLDKAEARARIIEGLKIALDNIDAIIKTIRSSRTQIAKNNLIEKFSSVKTSPSNIRHEITKLGLEGKQ